MKQYSFLKKPFGFLLILIASSFILSMYSCGGGGSGTSGTSSNLTPITQKNAKSIGITQNNILREIGKSSNIISYVLDPVSNSLNSDFYPFRSETNTNRLQNLFYTVRNIFGTNNNSSILNDLRSIRNNTAGTASSYTGQDNCSFGGTYSYTGTYDSDSNNYNVKYTFDKCNYGDNMLNGSFTLKGIYTGTKADFTIKTDNLTSISEDNTTFSIELNNASFTFNGTQDATTDNISITSTINGTFNAFYDNSTDNNSAETLTYNNLSYNMKESGDGNSGSITVNGKITDKSVSDNNSIATTLKNFTVGFKMDSYRNSDTTINGTISIQYSPDKFCSDGSGTYQFVTNKPMHHDSASGYVISGKLTINNSEVITYSDDGIILVTLNSNPIYIGNAEGFFKRRGECILSSDTGWFNGW